MVAVVVVVAGTLSFDEEVDEQDAPVKAFTKLLLMEMEGKPALVKVRDDKLVIMMELLLKEVPTRPDKTVEEADKTVGLTSIFFFFFFKYIN